MSKTAVVRAKVQLPANIAADLNSEVADIQKRIGTPAGNRIKVTQKKTFRLPTGEESPGPIDLVILDFIAAHYFYEGTFDPDDITPPGCFALGREIATLTPHETAVNKQADTCAVCPQNQFGSAQRGKGKACSNCRLLAVLPLDAVDDTPIQILKVSPTGLRSFDAYVAGVARTFQLPPIGVATKVGFDPTPDFPSLRFAEPQRLDDDRLAFYVSRREEARQILMTPPDTTSLKVEQPKPAAGAKRKARV